MNKLKQRREDLGYTQEEMAEKLGVTNVAYHMYESGKRKIPREKAMEISEILNIPQDIFLPESYSIR